MMKDKRRMKIDRISTIITERDVHQAFAKLDMADRETFLSLHEGVRPLSTKPLRIYKANAFEEKDTSYIYFNVSRINHCCLPNAETSADQDGCAVIAIKTIAKGEEIFITYRTDYKA